MWGKKNQTTEHKWRALTYNERFYEMAALPSLENIATFARRLLREEVRENCHLIKSPERCRQCRTAEKCLKWVEEKLHKK